MTSEFSIQEFLDASNAERSGRVEIRGKIVSGYEDGFFSLVDISGSVKVKASPKFGCQILPGKFVKLVNPELQSCGEKCLALTNKSRMLPSRRIKELVDSEIKTIQTKDADGDGYPSLEMIGHLNPQDKVSEIRVIILKDQGINRPGANKTPVKKLIVKDRYGTNGTISVWSHFIDQVQLNKIYKITNMRVEKWPLEKPHQISTTFASKITDVTQEMMEEFKDVSLVDGSICGNVEVFHNIHKYDCCVKCRSKVDDSMIRCSKCEAILHERKQTFRYELCLNPGDDNVVNITGFYPSTNTVVPLPYPLPKIEEIEDQLNDLEKKSIKVEFTVNKNKEKIVHSIAFKN